LLLAGAVVGLTGCRVSQYGFLQDTRVHITSPGADAVVKTPLTVAWTAPGIHLGSSAQGPAEYAVFVDRNPMQPGQGLKSLCSHNDTHCRNTPGQPDAAYLAQSDVFLTKSTSVTLPNLPPQTPPQLHTITVALLNSAGQRIGEAAYSVEFET
jgi:hypothetical protein